MQVIRFITVTALLCLTTSVQAKEQLKVSVYYESLCPYSIRFIKDQLLPAYRLIGEHLDVDFVPYGNARQKLVDGKWLFECQHGNEECHGNKMQACALQQAQPQSVFVPFIGCVMSAYDPSQDAEVQKCAVQHEVSWKQIDDCTDSEFGDNVLAAYGDRTYAVVPAILGVPTVVFNDVHEEHIQDDAVDHFLKTACSQFKTKPENCP